MTQLHLPPAVRPLRERLAPLAPWLPVLTLTLGIGLGGFVGIAASNPTGGDQYSALRAEFDASQRSNSRLIDRVTRAESALAAQAAAAAQLDQREAVVAAREAAVTQVEQQIAATSIGEGIWTVGIDIEPGTYRTAQALTGYCYWAILRSGTNGSDIIDNDGPEGGFPTVTLSAGQDFRNSGCGTFVRQ